MKSLILFLCSIYASFPCFGLEEFNPKLKEGEVIVEQFMVKPGGSGVITIQSTKRLWVGFDFQFPQSSLDTYTGKQVFKIDDKNSYVGISSGGGFGDIHAGTAFVSVKGNIKLSYENLTDVSFPVAIWKKKFEE